MSSTKMVVERNIAVPMRDGTQLRANVFKPEGTGPFPTLVAATPYGKDVAACDAMPAAWNALVQNHPEVLEHSSGAYITWETCDPEVWTGKGYAVVNMDVRGTGKSPGVMDPNSPAEVDDCCDLIAWAAAQFWSTGAIGLLGIGYHTAANWSVAAKRPPQLKAVVFHQGTFDFYRDRTRNDGIYSQGFNNSWWNAYGLNNQHGNSECTLRDMYTGEVNTGPEALSKADLAANRVTYLDQILAHPLLDEWYHDRIADLGKIEVPSLVVANWGGLGVQSRGTIAGWQGLSSPDKWLIVEDGSYFFTFYLPARVAEYASFFDRYLKAGKGDWNPARARVSVREPDGLSQVIACNDWPVPGTEVERLYLDFETAALADSKPQLENRISYRPFKEGIKLTTAPLRDELSIAGPLALRLCVTCETEDTDLFVTLQSILPDGTELSFLAATDPAAPLTQGWLRVSQRKCEIDRSRAVGELMPVHSHDERQPLVPGQAYEVLVSLWPASVRLPRGSYLRLTIGGTDFERPEGEKPKSPVFLSHNDPRDRPHDIFGGRVTLHSGPESVSELMLPRLPAELLQ